MTSEKAAGPHPWAMRIGRIFVVVMGVITATVGVYGLSGGFGSDADLIVHLTLVVGGVLVVVDPLTDFRNPYGIRYVVLTLGLALVAYGHFWL